MKSCILSLVFLCLVVSACGRNPSSRDDAQVGWESFSIREADRLLVESSQGSVEDLTKVDSAVLDQNKDILSEESKEDADFPNPITIQKALKNLGLYDGELDGKIGPKTKKGIREFQRQNKLVIDGKVGPKTWAILKEAVDSSQ